MTTARIDEIYKNKMGEFHISNVVSTYVLAGRDLQPLFIDLLIVALAFEGSVYYNSKQFPNLVIRTSRPIATVLLYQRGVMLCMSAKSENESTKAVYYVLRKLRNLIYPDLCICTRNVINVVSYLRTEIPCDTKLMLLQYSHCANRPDKFSGTIIQLGILNSIWGKISATIFKDGAFVITGAKSTEEAQRVYMFFLDFIRPYLIPKEILSELLDVVDPVINIGSSSANICINTNMNINTNTSATTNTSTSNKKLIASVKKKTVQISLKPSLQNCTLEKKSQPQVQVQVKSKAKDKEKKERSLPAVFTCKMCNNPCVSGEKKKRCCLCTNIGATSSSSLLSELCRFCKEFQDLTENITKSIHTNLAHSNKDNPWLDPLYA